VPRWAASLGLNRSTLAVLIVVGGLGLSEELWRNFLAVYLNVRTGDVARAVGYMGVYATLLNLAEGFGYILGGAFAHRLGPRAALAISAAPMAAGFALLLATQQPWAIVAGALLLTNWEPLSVPATFEVVGASVDPKRRTIAFAVQSIQKRLPKVLGPLIGGLVFAAGYWLNLTLAIAVLAGAIVAQAVLLRHMKPRPDPAPVPLGEVLRRIPPELKQLLSAEILLRWGDWFVRDFAALYVVAVLGRSAADYGLLASLTAFTALATYIPVGKLVDRAASPKPFIAITFFLFSAFPFALVLLPRTGMPLMAALVLAFVVNGLREVGEPARKAAIAAGMPPEIRARAVGLYWGLRSFFFCPAPLAAWWLWERFGPEAAFLTGGAIGLCGTAWFVARVRLRATTSA
jgi:MFS family permease